MLKIMTPYDYLITIRLTGEESTQILRAVVDEEKFVQLQDCDPAPLRSSFRNWRKNYYKVEVLAGWDLEEWNSPFLTIEIRDYRRHNTK